MSKESLLELFFTNGDYPQLIKTKFYAPSYPNAILGIRGYNAAPNVAPFKWSVATHALSLFFAKAVQFYLENKLDEIILEGREKSPANTIANLLYKRPTCWVLDLFGVDSTGRSLLMHPILCCNYSKRRPGPIQVFFRVGYYNPQSIKIYFDDIDISKNLHAIVKLRENLEHSWQPGEYANAREQALAA